MSRYDINDEATNSRSQSHAGWQKFFTKPTKSILSPAQVAVARSAARKDEIISKFEDRISGQLSPKKLERQEGVKIDKGLTKICSSTLDKIAKDHKLSNLDKINAYKSVHDVLQKETGQAGHQMSKEAVGKVRSDVAKHAEVMVKKIDNQDHKHSKGGEHKKSSSQDHGKGDEHKKGSEHKKSSSQDHGKGDEHKKGSEHKKSSSQDHGKSDEHKKGSEHKKSSSQDHGKSDEHKKGSEHKKSSSQDHGKSDEHKKGSEHKKSNSHGHASTSVSSLSNVKPDSTPAVANRGGQQRGGGRF